jgi:hypothetical protein
MRSDLVFDAIKYVSNRFLLARLLAKTTREFHIPGARIEDTTNDALMRCGCANPVAGKSAALISASVGSPAACRTLPLCIAPETSLPVAESRTLHGSVQG